MDGSNSSAILHICIDSVHLCIWEFSFSTNYAAPAYPDRDNVQANPARWGSCENRRRQCHYSDGYCGCKTMPIYVSLSFLTKSGPRRGDQMACRKLCGPESRTADMLIRFVSFGLLQSKSLLIGVDRWPQRLVCPISTVCQGYRVHRSRDRNRKRCLPPG